MLGNPTQQVAGPYKVPAIPQRKIRCLIADFYAVDREPAVKGRVYSLDAPIARSLVEQQRAEYADK